jgi:hypothetical protein
MLFQILKYAIPALLPFALYALWLWIARLQQRAGVTGWRDAPWMLLTAAGLVLLVASLFATALLTGSPPEGTYVPPRLEDGRIVPGRVE